MPTNVASIIESITGMSYVPTANESPVQVQNQQRRCQYCDSPLNASAIECPNCGGINLDNPRRRQENRRPGRERVTLVQSDNLNGQYAIYKNSDNSLSCNCLSFLFQRGVENGVGFSTCKHVRQYMHYGGGVDRYRIEGANKPTQWQLAALKRLGIAAADHLTDAQAYFIFGDLLAKQGVEYREYERLLREHQTVSLLPIYTFGLEFEGGVSSSHGTSGMAQKLSETGVITQMEGYSHATRSHWKIVSDGSVSVERGYTPLELVSRKLYGMEGFKEVEKALTVWNGLGANVNKSCGTHAHVDAWNWELQDMLELAKIWAKIEAPVLWYFVSSSRRNNRYCKRVDENYLITLATHGPSGLDRYYSLNLSAFIRHRTIEFRMHNGTLDAKKIIPWVIFLLKLTDSVKKGLRHSDVEPTFEGVMDAVGLSASATCLLKDAREYLCGRYEHWKEDARRTPSHVPNVPDVAVDNLEEMIGRRREQARRQNIMRHYSTRAARSYVSADSSLRLDCVRNIAAQATNRTLPTFEVIEQARNGNTWQIRSATSDQMHTVTHDEATDTITCTCRGFRGHGHCYHSVAVARWLMAHRENRQ